MKTYRVTIIHNATLISTTVPAYTGDQAIDKIIEANSLVGEVVSEKAELLKTN